MLNSKPLGIFIAVFLIVIGVGGYLSSHADGIQQPAHVLGAFSTNDCAKINASGFLVTNGAGCSGASATQIFSFGGGFVNGGFTITATIALPVTAPAACTIIAWELSIPKADTGTATVKFLKVAAGTSSPAIGDSINTSGVALSAGTHVRSTTLTDFTSLVVTAGDIIAADLITVGGSPTGLTATVECQ